MRENRNAIYVTIILTGISLILSGVITYCERIRILFLQPDFIVNCFLGLFSGSILALVIASINYSATKRRELTEYANFVNCLNISIIPIYNLFKNGERNLDYELEIIISVYNILVANLHMKPSKFYFLIPKQKVEKKIDEILALTFELYEKILDLKLLADKYKFKCISQEELDCEIMEFFLYLRNYHDESEILYTNVLTKKHKEFLKLAHLQYTHSGKIDI